MRAYEGQKSDNVVIKRTRAEKQVRLGQLKDRLANMRSHESAVLRASIERTIGELERELAR